MAADVVTIRQVRKQFAENGIHARNAVEEAAGYGDAGAQQFRVDNETVVSDAAASR